MVNHGRYHRGYPRTGTGEISHHDIDVHQSSTWASYVHAGAWYPTYCGLPLDKLDYLRRHSSEMTGLGGGKIPL